MTTAPSLTDVAREIGANPDRLDEAFALWAYERGLELYPAQAEAMMEIVTGSHVVLATPTGSGKSLVAIGAHFKALGFGERSYYTAPLKALVSEKFFALVEVFGAENVGMMTGDSAVNADAPIICCTAEILANVALREGSAADAGLVVMDEFHFYGDPQRGWAWQVPLLELPRAQFLLMSATLGDTTRLTEDLAERTGRPVAEVTSVERPVPLMYSYVTEPLTEVISELLETKRAPVYLVHFTQKDAVERAQALLSTPVATRSERDLIAEELGDFRFTSGFGKTLSKLLRHGVGVHHAGMLPRYRRVVERLTQRGLLKVICGTDTLGVGINVPIRTVLFTSLGKFDGERMRHLTAREFHQIAGRAGRAGHDTIGDVIVMAPEYIIDNQRALAKAGDDPKKLRKVVRKKPPEGAVNWTEKTFERLRDAAPEPLVSQFHVSHSMVLNVLSRDDDPVAAMAHLLRSNHDSSEQRSAHIRRAIHIYRSLRLAGVVERVVLPADDVTPGDSDAAAGARRPRATVRLTMDIPPNFALNQPLSPFALAAMDLVDVESPTHTLDVISVIESTLDNPRQVLVAQMKKAKGEAIAMMKAEGYDYDERMAALEEVTWPRPLADILEPAFTMFAKRSPWLADLELSPKSVVRDMLEQAMTFPELISRYGLERSEGSVLRYLTDAYRALRQSVPTEHRTEELNAVVDWLGALVRGVDSSLLDEWELLSAGKDLTADSVGAFANGDGVAEVARFTADERTLTILVRNAMFHRVELAAREAYEALEALDGASGWDVDRWADALDPFFVEHGDDAVGIDAPARSRDLLDIGQEKDSDGARIWRVRQVLSDPAGHHDWAITAVVDLDASDEQERLVLRIDSVGPFAGENSIS